MNPFEKHFKATLVTEADETPEPAVSNPADAAAWEKSLDHGTDPQDFNAAINPEFGAMSQNLELVKQWIHRIEEFRHFINGLDGDSLNAQINKLDRSGSVFKGLVRSEENRIIRLAEDLAGIAEVFKAYMIGSEKKMRDMKDR